MPESLVEYQLENALRNVIGDKAGFVMKRVSKLAAKQGGATTLENYKLLGKRALIALGVTVVAVQAVTSLVGMAVSKRNEEQRVERVVRRVLEEERARAEA
ncbi:MAG: hypothetical protein IJ131_07040 [Eggerthellaceae bacterium]|nr:hypothetical protein [Eggerthellaceae bacterium]